MSSLGMAIGSAVPTDRIGQIIGTLLVVVFILFSGNLVSLESLPDSIRWLQYISPVGYTIKALSQNEFKGLVLTCPDHRGLCYLDGDQVTWSF
jgi:ABC-type multidrug transport system permease subunit